MKVKLNGYSPLRLHLLSEGDTLVEKNEDVFITEQSEGVVPEIALQILGYELKDGDESAMITKWFSSEWNEQTYVSFPLSTLMSKGLGYKRELGRVGRFVVKNPLEDVFQSLKNTFNEMKYKGFVSIKVNAKMEMIEVLFGAGLSLYSLFEGIRNKISEFMTKGGNILESWSACLVVSRYPYPFQDSSDRLFLDLESSATKHLWFYDINVSKNSAFTDLTKVCLVTAWATSLNDLSKRIYRTCQGLNIDQMQYRTDIKDTIANSWIDYLNCRK